MAIRKWNKIAISAKIEAAPGTDAAPTAALNAMQVSDVKLQPLAGEEVKRDLLRPYFGDQGSLLVGNYVELEMSVELTGAGAAGTAPAYGPLLRGCGMAETLVANTTATYLPASGSQETLTIYPYLDGVLHKMVYVRGTYKLEIKPKAIPKITFTMRGLLGGTSDIVAPAAVYTMWKDPVAASKTNTTFALHGVSAPVESLSIDIGNTIEARHLIGAESIEITDRAVKGEVVIQADLLAVKDWYGVALATTKGSMSLVHGLTAGSIVELAAPKVQIGRPSIDKTQGIINTTLPLMLTPNTGDDEFSLIVR